MFLKHKEFKPHIPTSLSLNFDNLFYNPSVDRLDGYTQLPCPLGKPYENQMRMVKVNKDRINDILNFAKTQLKFTHATNRMLFQRINDPVLEDNERLKYLTMSIQDFKNSKNPEDPLLDELLRDKEGNQIRQKYVKKIMEPYTTRFDKTMIESSKREKEIKIIENTKKEEDNKLQNAMISNINTDRYILKVTHERNKTLPFITTDRYTENLIGSFVEDKGRRSMDIQSLNTKINLYTTSTFDKKVILKNFQDKNSFEKLKLEHYYLEKMKKEALELKGTDVLKKQLLTCYYILYHRLNP